MKCVFLNSFSCHLNKNNTKLVLLKSFFTGCIYKLENLIHHLEYNNLDIVRGDA